MQISIIVPIFDEARALPGTVNHLRSLIEAGRPRTEAIVVDGGSTDGSRELVIDAGLPCVRSPRGRAEQMNAGARFASGDLLLFLHADTRLPAAAPDRIRHAVRDGAVGGCFGVRLDSDRLLLRLAGRMISWRSRLTGGATGDQAIFVTREAFYEVGGYAPVALFEDLDLSRRLRRLGEFVRLREEVTTSARRWERFGVWRTILRMWALRTLYLCGVSPDRLARYYDPVR